MAVTVFSKLYIKNSEETIFCLISGYFPQLNEDEVENLSNPIFTEGVKKAIFDSNLVSTGEVKKAILDMGSFKVLGLDRFQTVSFKVGGRWWETP